MMSLSSIHDCCHTLLATSCAFINWVVPCLEGYISLPAYLATCGCEAEGQVLQM